MKKLLKRMELRKKYVHIELKEKIGKNYKNWKYYFLFKYQLGICMIIRHFLDFDFMDLTKKKLNECS